MEGSVEQSAPELLLAARAGPTTASSLTTRRMLPSASKPGIINNEFLMFVFRSWQNGFCIGGRGNNCPLRHYYNERDGQLAQSKRFQDSGVSKENVDFSSPYSVKVRKEVEKQRMEEVDLDTGRRRSWVETKEFEVFDLTGETPARPKRSPLSDKSNKPDNVVTNLARELKAAAEEEDGNLKRKAGSPLPGKEKPGIKRGSKRVPLADIMVSGTEEETGDGPMKPPSAPEAIVSSNQCPVCQKTFKSSRGVTCHRSSRNSTCKTGKSPKSVDKSTSGSDKGKTKETTSARNILATHSTPHVVRSVQDESVILIEDTPPSASTRAGVRRSIRAQE